MAARVDAVIGSLASSMAEVIAPITGQAGGGQLAAEVPYESGADTDFERVVRQMLAGKPDGPLFIAGALDVARLAQQTRRDAPRLPFAASE